MCVGEIISLPWFFKELKNDLSKNNCLRSVILILLFHESIFVGWGSPFSIVLVPRYKLSVSHSYQTWFTWLSGNWCLCVWVAWPRDHEVRINMHPSNNMNFCTFKSKSDNIIYANWHIKVLIILNLLNINHCYKNRGNTEKQQIYEQRWCTRNHTQTKCQIPNHI